MKTCHFLTFQRLWLLCLATLFLGSAAPLLAESNGRQLLKMELSADRRIARVTVPDGVKNVTLQRFEREGGWRKVIVSNAIPGEMNIKLPASGKLAKWRAIGRYDGVAAVKKFPANYFQGENRFGPVKAGTSSSVFARDLVATPGMASNSVGNESAGVVPVEADIWKIEDKTVYFFNQLRGLQVLNLADPADPRLTASLRLPAVGQDLYVLPGSGSARTVILLTEGWSPNGGQWTRINVVEVNGGKAELTHSQDVAGSLADSRLAGKRLILATTEWNYGDGISSNGWSVKSRLTEWLLESGKAPEAAGETLIDGYSPLIASGANWLALAIHPKGQWDVSEVSVFAIRPNGLVRMGPPVQTTGSVESKFGMQWSDNVLTTISESNQSANGWSPTTYLENFRVWAPDVIHPAVVEDRLGVLELAEGERLFATRFAGDKVYVVTFLQTDPLWVVDLSDPANPTIAGSLEVPGWSSYLQPIGDLLFAVGWEGGTITASLFDVADPANPGLLSRLDLGAPGTFSEALWDEQALKVLPDVGLAMIPVSRYDGNAGGTRSAVQLVDIDVNARELRLRGAIHHEFDARRSDLIGDAVVSVSQRVLVTADITDRNAPDVLAEVSLAWPVNRILEAAGHLFQFEDGGSYSGGRATVRISKADASEEILSEVDLGAGTVKAADYRDGKLYVLRQTGNSYWYFYRSPVTNADEKSQLILDIYDASTVTGLNRIGSSAMALESGNQVEVDDILWPQPNRPAVLMDFRFSYWFGWYRPMILETVDSIATTGIATAAVKSSIALPYRPYWVPQQAPRLVLFDSTDPAAPSVGEAVDLGPEGLMSSGVSKAEGGLIVVGTTQWNNEEDDSWYGEGIAVQAARVIEVGPSGPPVLRPLIDLPGKLFAVTEFDANGFLAFTQTEPAEGGVTLQVSACDGFDAYLVAGFEESSQVVATAGGRRVFVAKPNGVARKLLNDEGVFVDEPMIELGWTPYSLRWIKGTLAGSNWNSLFAADSSGDSVSDWTFQTWSLDLSRVVLADDGDLLVPFGEYGAERLKR